MKICISAGGTGGHIYPAIALADELVKKGHELFYIGNQDKMEATIVKDKPYTFLPIKNEGLKPGLLAKIKGITSQFKAIKQCKDYLKKYQIDFVVSFGGYVTFPVCVAAAHLKIPYLLHEQNSIAGKANKAVTRHAAGVIVCFNEVIHQFKHADIRFLGNPRASIAAKTDKDNQFMSRLGLNPTCPLVYIVMGSLGSSSVSEMLIQYLNQNPISDYQLVISAGRQFDVYEKHLKSQPQVKVFETVDQIQLLKQAQIVVSRAGATSIAEICASLTPAIYIPSPYVVANHQYFNALELVNHGAALMIQEKDLTAEKLFSQIHEMLTQPQQLTTMKQNLKSFAKTDALEKIIEWIGEVSHES